jgi:hypothetical protein
MAIGGWTSGAIYDLIGSYRTAVTEGIACNLLNMTIGLWLLLSHLRPVATPPEMVRLTSTQ